MKQLYKGIYNLNTEMKILYAYANTPEQARVVMARRIAKMQGALPAVVLGYLKDHPESCKIKTEMEWREK